MRRKRGPGSRYWGEAAPSQGILASPRARRDEGMDSLQTLQREGRSTDTQNAAQLIAMSDCWPPELYEVNFYCSKPPNLWLLLITAIGHNCTYVIAFNPHDFLRELSSLFS